MKATLELRRALSPPKPGPQKHRDLFEGWTRGKFICPPHGSRSLESPGHEIPQIARFTILLISHLHISSLIFIDFRRYLYNMTRNMYIVLHCTLYRTAWFCKPSQLAVSGPWIYCLWGIPSGCCVHSSAQQPVQLGKKSKGLNVSRLCTSYIKTIKTYESRMTSILADLIYLYLYNLSISPTINKLYKSKFITGCCACSSLAFLTRSWLLQNLGQCSSQAQAQSRKTCRTSASVKAKT